jgi:hypothetical protein
MRKILGLLIALFVIGAAITVAEPAAVADVSASATCGGTPPSSGGTPSSVEGGFHALTPIRLVDTRATVGQIGGGCTLAVDTLTWVPGDATAAAIDVVAVDADGPGFVTVYPCDAERPLASSLNTRTSIAIPNAVVVPLERGRRICLYTSIATQLVVDLTGYFAVAGEPFHGLTPTRVLDTRTGPRPDGGSGPFASDTTTRVPIAGIGDVPASAEGVVVNVTVADTSAPGYLTVFPCGTAPPTVSNLNYLTNDIRANHALVGLDGGGALCVYTQWTTSVILDVAGWFGGDGGSRLVPVVGTRVLDSRNGTGGWSTPLHAGETRAFDVGRDGTLPVGQNVALNVTATNARGTGYLTLFPCGASMPPTSSLNYHVGDDVANLAVVPVGTRGQVCAFSLLDVDVVVDVVGSLGTPGPLLSLAVSGRELMPTFTPDGHNYGVVCATGANAWQVTTSAVHGATVAVAGADGAGNVSVSPGEAVVVTVTKADATKTEYWVRCLPPDFPPLDVQRRDVTTPGWYLVAPTSWPYVIILDDHGGPVWYQNAGGPAIDAKLLPNGDLAWVHLLGPTYGVDPNGAYVEKKLDGTQVRTWSTVGTPTDHHDMQPLANGNMLMISYHQRSGVDVSALGPGYTSPAVVADTWLQEITPAGTVAWQWKSEDHIGVAETVAQQDSPTILTTPPPVIDLLHTNSVDVDPVTGDVIVSSRHLDAVFRIRRDPGQADDGKVLWKLGGSAPTDPATKDLQVVGDPYDGPHRQHDARLLPDGHVTMFDNESFRPGASSRGVEYAVDAAAGTATLVRAWTRNDGLQAFGLGSTRRQPDGSTVVGWGAISHVFSEYLPGHDDVAAMTVKPKIGAQNYRVEKVPIGRLDEAQLRATAGA